MDTKTEKQLRDYDFASLNEEAVKELFRQTELKIEGIIGFSDTIDNKIYKLLSVCVAVSTALLFFVFKNIDTLSCNFILTSVVCFLVLFSCIGMLLWAGKPTEYKGKGLPMSIFLNHEMKGKEGFNEILIKSVIMYQKRFENNRALNIVKNKWLERATILICINPIGLSVIWFFLSISS